MSSRGRILVTPRSVTRDGHPSLARLEEAGYEVVMGPAGKQPSEEALRSLLSDCVGMLAGVEPISADVLRSAKSLKAISRNGTGTDTVDVAAAEELGIEILRAAGANARGVAELTFALLFALIRSIVPTDEGMKQAEWKRFRGVELEGRTLGLVGFGRIGQLVGQLASAFGMKILAYDPMASEISHSIPNLEFADLDTIWEQSDIISFHCPPPSDGQTLLNEATLAKTKKGVYVVNTARFDLMDESAVLKALDSGQVAGLGLDAFAQEPPSDFTLAAHSKVVATSHIGGFTKESVDRAMDTAVGNLLQCLAEKGNF